MKGKIALALLSIAVITIFVYHPVAKNGFVNWDDPLLLTRNREVANPSWENLRRVFTFKYAREIHQFHPLVFLALMAEHRLFGRNPAGYHLVNLLLHVIIALLVFWLVRIMTGRLAWAYMTALLFALHPMHVQSVAWVTELKDLLFALFYLAAMIAYLRFSDGKNRSWVLLSWTFFILAALSKSMALTLPVALLLLDQYRGRFNLKRVWFLLPFWLVSAALFALNVALFSGDAAARNPAGAVLGLRRLLAVPYGIFFLVNKMIFPFRLSPRYPDFFDSPHPLLSLFWLPGVLWLALTIWVVWRRHGHGEFFFGVLFFWIALLPVIGMFYLGFPPFDQYLYLPLLGFLLAGVAALAGGWTDRSAVLRPYPKAGAVLLLLATGVCGLLSRGLAAEWRNDWTLWNAAVGSYENYLVYNNRGQANVDRGDIAGAIRDFDASLALRMHHETLYNLGVAYEKKGDEKKALDYFNRSLEIVPRFAKALNNRGVLHFRRRDFTMAMHDFSAALRENPAYANAWLNRGILLLELKLFDQAEQDLRRAIACDPGMASSHYHLALAWAAQGRFDAAMTALDRAVQLAPDWIEPRFERGLILLQRGKFGEAEADLKEVLSRQPDFFPALDKLRDLLRSQGRRLEAP